MIIGSRKPKRFSKKPIGMLEVEKNEMSRGCPRNEWAEDAQNDMRIDPGGILGNVN